MARSFLVVVFFVKSLNLFADLDPKGLRPEPPARCIIEIVVQGARSESDTDFEQLEQHLMGTLYSKAAGSADGGLDSYWHSLREDWRLCTNNPDVFEFYRALFGMRLRRGAVVVTFTNEFSVFENWTVVEQYLDRKPLVQILIHPSVTKLNVAHEEFLRRLKVLTTAHKVHALIFAPGPMPDKSSIDPDTASMLDIP